jgi:hypothetical protein
VKGHCQAGVGSHSAANHSAFSLNSPIALLDPSAHSLALALGGIKVISPDN